MSELALRPVSKRILLEAVIICVVGIAIGLSVNYRMVLNAFSGKTVAAPPAQRVQFEEQSVQFPEPVELGELLELLAGGGLLIDARHGEDYRQAHLPGAISLPLGEVEQRLAQFKGEVEPERVLIIYCSGFGCPDSFDLGVRLLAAGYRRVRVFEGGFPEWRDSGRPLEGEQP